MTGKMNNSRITLEIDNTYGDEEETETSCSLQRSHTLGFRSLLLPSLITGYVTFPFDAPFGDQLGVVDLASVWELRRSARPAHPLIEVIVAHRLQ